MIAHAAGGGWRPSITLSLTIVMFVPGGTKRTTHTHTHTDTHRHTDTDTHRHTDDETECLLLSEVSATDGHELRRKTPGPVSDRQLMPSLTVVAEVRGVVKVSGEQLRTDRFEFSLCLSRACLGKMIVYIYKWRKRTVFSPAGARTAPKYSPSWPLAASPSRHSSATSSPLQKQSFAFKNFPMSVRSLSWQIHTSFIRTV
eukprot:COSAG06_NODE_64_length_26790_cov_7.462291_12_plen_200_part_00